MSVNKVISNKSEEILNFYKNGLSITQLSKKFKIAQSTIRFFLKRNNALRSRTEGIIISAKQGRLGVLKGKKRTFTEEWKKNISISKTNWWNKNAKGYSTKKSGYVVLTRGKNKDRTFHHATLEMISGYKLSKDMIVHHKDDNKSNNHLDNLELMTRSQHAKLHASKRSPYLKRDKFGKFIKQQ